MTFLIGFITGTICAYLIMVFVTLHKLLHEIRELPWSFTHDLDLFPSETFEEEKSKK